MISIDYDKIDSTFTDIHNKYQELISSNLQNAKSFKQLKQEKIPNLASDVKAIANKVVRSKTRWLSDTISSGFKFVRSNLTWLSKSNAKSDTNPRKCYWTNEMIGAASKIIPYILAIWTLQTASCYYEVRYLYFCSLSLAIFIK